MRSLFRLSMNATKMVLILCAFFCVGTADATTRTWAPFGYSVYDVFNYPFTTAPPLYSSKQAVCASYPSLIDMPGGSACSDPSVGDYCVHGGKPCYDKDGSPNAWLYSDSKITPSPVCTHTNLSTSPPIVDRRPPKPRNVRANIGWSASAESCACIYSSLKPMANVVPDLNTGWCYDPYSLDYTIASTRYTPSTAQTPVEVKVLVRRSDNTLVANAAVNLRVTTTDGTPGTITPTSGVTDSNGALAASYTFPQFDKKKVDVIELSCDTCGNAPLQINMTMAPTLVGFFNGVWNTENDANDGLTALKAPTNAVRASVSVNYGLFYNQSGCGHTGSTCLQDVAEVFMQRSQELNGVMSSRWEHFWDLLQGSQTAPKSNSGTLSGLLGSASSTLAQWLDSVFNAMLAQIFAGYAQMLSSPPTGADMAAHISKLQAYADQDYSFVLIAHSQGNLFVNAAYDRLRSSRPSNPAKVVHIAPASATTRGNYVLADIDLVINGLRLQGINSVPSANISLPTSKADLTGHTLVATYLDASRAALARVQSMIKSALAAL